MITIFTMNRLFTLMGVGMLLVFGGCSSSDDYPNVYLLEITFPPAIGRQEVAETMALYDRITNMDGVKIIFFVSQLGNSELLAVLDIENLCTWTTLSDVLSQAGVGVKTEPVVSCDHFAQELKANVIKYKLPFKTPVTHVVKHIYLDKGKTDKQYNTLMRTLTEQLQKIFYENGWDIYCFRTAVDVPVRVVYFSTEPLKATFNISTTMHVAEWMMNHMTEVADLQNQ